MTNAERQCRELWSKIVRHRDRWCVLCGSTHEIEAHHLFNKARGNWTIIYDVDYGVTLCKDHHQDTPVGSDMFEKLVARVRVKDESRADKILTRAQKPIAPCPIDFDAKITRALLREQWKKIKNETWMDADCCPGYGDPR